MSETRQLNVLIPITDYDLIREKAQVCDLTLAQFVRLAARWFPVQASSQGLTEVILDRSNVHAS